MPHFLPLRRLALLVLAPMCSWGCVSYQVRDHVEVQDRLIKDSRALSVELVGVQAPNVRLRLKLAGDKKIERTTITDRQVSYDAKSHTLFLIDEFGMTPGVVFAFTLGIATDVVQLAISGPIVLTVGFFESIDPADEVDVVVEQQDLQIGTSEDVLVRFGPRQLQKVRCQKGNQILVNARDAARTALANGREQITAQVRIDGGDLRASFVLGPEVLRQLAGK